MAIGSTRVSVDRYIHIKTAPTQVHFAAFPAGASLNVSRAVQVTSATPEAAAPRRE